MRKKLSACIFFALLVLTIISCNKQENVIVKGKLIDSKGKTLYFEELGIEDRIVLDSSRIRGNGVFTFKNRATIPKFYALRTDNNYLVTILAKPGDKVQIIANKSNISNGTEFTITGSKESVAIQMLDRRLLETKNKLDSIEGIYKAYLETPQNEQVAKELNELYANVIEKQRKHNIIFIVENCTSLASLYAIYQKYDSANYILNKTRDIQYYKILSDSLRKYYPGSQHVKSLVYNTNLLLNDYYNRRTIKMADEIGEIKLPGLNMPDPKGELVSLSSLKGKIVLLSFWSSLSKQSVADNIGLKKIYDKYKAKGFEVYQVSVDQSYERWIKAVDFDELPWVSVNDLEGLNSYAVGVYNVRSIPTSYLIDKTQQNIIAKNLTVAGLDNKLQQLLK